MATEARAKPAASSASGAPSAAQPSASQLSKGSDHMIVDPDKPDEGWMVRTRLSIVDSFLNKQIVSS